MKEIPNICPCCGKKTIVETIFNDNESKIIYYDCKQSLFGKLAPVMEQMHITATQAYNLLKIEGRL